jgi:hypothetical protein
MGARSYQPGSDSDHLAVNTDILEDWPQRQARELLIPQIAKKTLNALNTVPIYVEHFQRIRSGRRCSCFTVETEAAGLCPLCFGMGVVGGYQKRGTKVDVLDVTSPYTVCVNARPDYGALTRPIAFSLLETAVRGYVEFVWEPVRNMGVIDDLKLLDSVPEGTSITYSVRTPNDTDWVALDEAALTQRLATGSRLGVRVDLKRVSPSAPLPRFIGFRCSYRVTKLSAIRADIPRTNRSRTLEEFGIYDSFNAQQFAFGNDIRSIDNDDFFVVLQDWTRWKVTEWQDNKILGMNTAWDVTCRLIQNYDRYARVPLGRFDVLPSQMPPDAVRSMQTETEVYDSKGPVTHGRLPGMTADVDQAKSLSPMNPGQVTYVKPPAER